MSGDAVSDPLAGIINPVGLSCRPLVLWTAESHSAKVRTRQQGGGSGAATDVTQIRQQESSRKNVLEPEPEETFGHFYLQTIRH